MTVRPRLAAAIALLTIAAVPTVAARSTAPTVEATVLLMRHGVRAPLSTPVMPDGVADRPWAAWPVPRAELTPHGAAAVRMIGRSDAVMFKPPGAGCPRPDRLAVVADNDQRTRATAAAWIAGYAPGCQITIAALPDGQADPVFAPIEAGMPGYNAAAVTRAVEARLPRGGLAAVDADVQPLVRRLDTILCDSADRATCGIARLPTTIRAGSTHREPGLRGGLAEAAKAIQTLTLEYAEGMANPGWGRLTAIDIAKLGAVRAREYALVYRTPAVARAFGAPTAKRMLAALTSANDGSVSVFVGHDSNVAAVAGLLDLHWQAAGFAADDPPVGGAIGFQRLRDGAGDRFVRAIFRSASLDEIRTLTAPTPASTVQVVPIAACAPTPLACPIDRFAHLVEQGAMS